MPPPEFKVNKRTQFKNQDERQARLHKWYNEKLQMLEEIKKARPAILKSAGLKKCQFIVFYSIDILYGNPQFNICKINDMKKVFSKYGQNLNSLQSTCALDPVVDAILLFHQNKGQYDAILSNVEQNVKGDEEEEIQYQTYIMTELKKEVINQLR